MQVWAIVLIAIVYIAGAFWFAAVVLTALIKAAFRRDVERDRLDT
jgi:hypothetical protein